MKKTIKKWDNIIEKYKTYILIVSGILLLYYWNAGRSGIDAIIGGFGVGIILIAIGILALIVPGISNLSGIILIIAGACSFFIGAKLQSIADAVPGGFTTLLIGIGGLFVIINVMGKKSTPSQPVIYYAR